MLKKIFITTSFLLLAILLMIGCCFFGIKFYSLSYIYDDLEKIPKNKIGLLLGTAKYNVSGGINPYYKNRIQAAADLYHAHKVDFIIVSGANPNIYYNEPQQMRKDLVKLGVPNEKIQGDYAGFRTLDSILRAEKVFGQEQYTIISQAFHNERAIFLAKYHKQNVIAYNAKDPDSWRFRLKTEIREIGARVKAVIDVYFLKKQAKFYGDHIQIDDN